MGAIEWVVLLRTNMEQESNLATRSLRVTPDIISLMMGIVRFGRSSRLLSTRYILATNFGPVIPLPARQLIPAKAVSSQSTIVCMSLFRIAAIDHTARSLTA